MIGANLIPAPERGLGLVDTNHFAAGRIGEAEGIVAGHAQAEWVDPRFRPTVPAHQEIDRFLPELRGDAKISRYFDRLHEFYARPAGGWGPAGR